jgi:hypothetical protein
VPASLEQRRFPRLAVQASCRLGGGGACLDGVTENISRSGVLIRLASNGAHTLPGVGEVIGVDIDLPPNPTFGQKCLRCRGVVVRTTCGRGTAPSVAVEIIQIEFGQTGPVAVDAKEIDHRKSAVAERKREVL